jgi:succinoglycan biosynthesis transport protein ExoP
MNDQGVNVPGADRATRSARFFSHVHRYKNLLRRYWWVLPLTAAIAVGVQLYRLMQLPPSFLSFASMIVNVKLTGITGASVYAEEMSNFLGTQVTLMKSDRVQQRAVERIRALKPELAAGPVLLHIVVPPKTTVFSLKAVGSHAEYTRAYLEACMEEYINLKKELRQSSSDITLAGIQEELTRAEKELRRGEEELLKFQSSNSVVLIQEQGGSAANYLVTLNRRLAEFKTEYQLLKKLNFDQSLEFQKTKPALAANPDSDDGNNNDASKLLTTGSEYLKVKQKLQLLRAQEKEMSEYLRPKHPKMIALSEEIAQNERLVGIFKEQSLEQLENRSKSLELQIENLEREIKDWEATSLDISARMALHQRIKSNIDRNRLQYENLQKMLQTVGVGKEIEPETVTILKGASPAIADRPNMFKMLGLGLAMGLIAGLLILLLLDRFDDRPNSFTELTELFDEPVLGQIPLQMARRKEDLQLIHADDDRHAFVEAYRNLRSSLHYMATEGKRPKLILVTSAIPGDGKSMTTANLAITMAQGGVRVLLVDADLRKGILHKKFNISATPGLSEILSQGLEWSKFVVATHAPNLSLLPRGNVSRNPGELFLTSQIQVRLKEMADLYDYVIIDSAPVMAADDVTSLSPHVEGVIFVVRARYTSARVVHAALELLAQREVDVLGLVFNGVEARAAEYYFYKYKDYYAVYPGA